jgi:hypothetical protein
MRRHFNRVALTGIFLVIIALFGFAAMFLWNWLLPAIFGLPELTYVQALGLLVLSRIFFGGAGFGGLSRMAMGFAGGNVHGNPFRERWMQMSDEERKEFIAKRHDFHDFFGERNGKDDKTGGAQ